MNPMDNPSDESGRGVNVDFTRESNMGIGFPNTRNTEIEFEGIHLVFKIKNGFILITRIVYFLMNGKIKGLQQFLFKKDEFVQKGLIHGKGYHKLVSAFFHSIGFQVYPDKDRIQRKGQKIVADFIEINIIKKLVGNRST